MADRDALAGRDVVEVMGKNSLAAGPGTEDMPEFMDDLHA
jgi:hypothetical protein